MNFTRMHIFTHVRPEFREKSGMPGNEYADGMWEHDQDVGKMLKQLDDLGIAKDTIVIYTTDNGPNMFSWPDAAMTPFRSEKDSNWEGAFRVPAMIRWPGHIKAGAWSNEIVSGQDWFPTLVAAGGNPNITEQLLAGKGPGGMAHKVHLDGYNILPYLEGKEAHSPRRDFYYFDDDGQLVAMRHDNWKFVFCEQRAPGNMVIWSNPFTCLRLAKIYNLRMDPYERADITSDQYYDWIAHNVYLSIQGQIRAIQFMETFREYPPSQAPASFSIDPEGILKMLERQKAAAAGGK
jgi:arylsulfatase